MTQAPVGLPPYLQPRGRAPASSSSTTSLHALSSSATPQLSRASSRSRQEPSRAAATTLPTELSDKATHAFIRRVLCPHAYVGPSDTRSIDELLPPLSSSNEIDLELYAILAIIIKEFVCSWYGKITVDQGFVEEVVRIFAHCTRALEQRVRKLNIEGLFLDEIPQLVEEHINAFRTSGLSVYPPSLSLTVGPRAVYHILIPHPAFSPAPDVKDAQTVEEQHQNEVAYRQLLVQGALAVLLPTEDLGNACLRTFVTDVIGEMILGNGIGNKACEGWLIWEGITKMAEKVSSRGGLPPETTEPNTKSRLQQFGLLSERHGDDGQQGSRGGSGLSEVFWRILQHCYLTFLAVQFMLVGLFTASSRAPDRVSSSSTDATSEEESGKTERAMALTGKRAILSFKIFSVMSLLLDLSNRTPWLMGSLCLVRYHLIRRPLRLGATGGLVDNFVHNLLRSHVFNAERVPPLLHTIRTSLFPNNAPAPPRVTPSAAEQVEIRRHCAEVILDLIPRVVATRFFAPRLSVSPAPGKDIETTILKGEAADLQRQQMLLEIEGVLDVFGDAYMNKHLIFGIVELCIVRLLPEVGEMTITQLMETRLGEGWEER